MIPSAIIHMDRQTTRILLSTASGDGTPHLASAGDISCLPDDRVTIHYWFCPQTLANLRENSRCSLVLWDTETDEGYQLVGKVDEIQELEMMDGYLPQDSSGRALPQVKYGLIISVKKVLEFKHTPHSDLQLAPAPAAARG